MQLQRSPAISDLHYIRITVPVIHKADSEYQTLLEKRE